MPACWSHGLRYRQEIIDSHLRGSLHLLPVCGRYVYYNLFTRLVSLVRNCTEESLSLLMRFPAMLHIRVSWEQVNNSMCVHVCLGRSMGVCVCVCLCECVVFFGSIWFPWELCTVSFRAPFVFVHC